MRCVAWCIPRGVSYVRVSQRRLAMPLQDMDLKARHSSFLCGWWLCNRKQGTTKGKHKMYCTKCGNQVDDSVAFCTKCGAPMNGRTSTANEAVLPAYDAGGPRRPKIPGVTLTACIILYVAFGLSIIGILSEGDAEPDEVVGFVVVLELFAIACTVLTQIGLNWARIVLTVILGLLLIPNLGNVAIFILMCAFFVPPLVFLWLPRSNNWYRAIKSRNK